jgi:hypothetical protein
LILGQTFIFGKASRHAKASALALSRRYGCGL